VSRELGISHVTVCRWFWGEGIPGTESCLKIAEFLGIRVAEVLAMTGRIPELSKVPTERLPEFREYVERKYPGLLDDDEIEVFEQLIERRRVKKEGSLYKVLRCLYRITRLKRRKELSSGVFECGSNSVVEFLPSKSPPGYWLKVASKTGKYTS